MAGRVAVADRLVEEGEREPGRAVGDHDRVVAELRRATARERGLEAALRHERLERGERGRGEVDERRDRARDPAARLEALELVEEEVEPPELEGETGRALAGRERVHLPHVLEHVALDPERQVARPVAAERQAVERRARAGRLAEAALDRLLERAEGARQRFELPARHVGGREGAEGRPGAGGLHEGLEISEQSLDVGRSRGGAGIERTEPIASLRQPREVGARFELLSRDDDGEAAHADSSGEVTPWRSRDASPSGHGSHLRPFVSSFDRVPRPWSPSLLCQPMRAADSRDLPQVLAEVREHGRRPGGRRRSSRGVSRGRGFLSGATARPRAHGPYLV